MHIRNIVFAVVAAFLCGSVSQAQATASVTLNAVLAERLSLSASPSTVNFTLSNGTVVAGSAPVAINTTWLMQSTRSSVKVFAWFATPAAALTDSAATPDNIPSTSVLGQVTTGAPTTFTAFSQTNPLGSTGGGLMLFTQPLSLANRSFSRVDLLALEIDLTALSQLPAGAYSGVLNLQAQSF